MYDPFSPQQRHKDWMDKQRDMAGYEEWKKRQPQQKGFFAQLGDAIAWIVFLGVGLLIVLFLMQAFGS